MQFWNFPSLVPVLLGYYRLIEDISVTLDFLLFEIIMCAILYFVTRGILLLKVKKLEQANEDANVFYQHLSEEPNSLMQCKCLKRCLNVSDAALNEYDSLLMYIGNLQRQPSRKVCTQCLPLDFDVGKINSEESFQCLRNDISVHSGTIPIRFAE